MKKFWIINCSQNQIGVGFKIWSSNLKIFLICLYTIIVVLLYFNLNV